MDQQIGKFDFIAGFSLLRPWTVAPQDLGNTPQGGVDPIGEAPFYSDIEAGSSYNEWTPTINFYLNHENIIFGLQPGDAGLLYGMFHPSIRLQHGRPRQP